MNIRPMTDVEKRSAAKAFVKAWTGRGDEKQDAQNFWRQLLSKVYGVEDPETDVLFEYPVKAPSRGRGENATLLSSRPQLYSSITKTVPARLYGSLGL